MSHGIKRTGRYRLSLALRIAAATIGAYGLTALITMLLSQFLRLVGMDPAQAVLAATIPAFLFYAALVCAIFHARSATRAWAMLAIAGMLIGCLVATLARLIP